MALAYLDLRYGQRGDDEGSATMWAKTKQTEAMALLHKREGEVSDLEAKLVSETNAAKIKILRTQSDNLRERCEVLRMRHASPIDLIGAIEGLFDYAQVAREVGGRGNRDNSRETLISCMANHLYILLSVYPEVCVRYEEDYFNDRAFLEAVVNPQIPI